MLWDFSLLYRMNNNQLLKLRELSIGYTPKETPLPQIRNSSDAYRLLKDLFEPNSLGLNEQFVVLYMNRANRVIGGLKAFKGGISATVVDHRIIFATALKVLASGIVIAHNHPSGNLDASDEDLKLTKKIKEVGELLDVRLIDHLILGIDDDYSSFAEKGWM
jgi:DNA repair protein RadC